MTQPEGAPKRADYPCTLNASGAGTIQITNNNSFMVWKITQLSVISVPTSAAVCVVSPPTGIVDTAYFAGTGDTAGGDPYWLHAGDFLELEWSSGPANGVGLCTIYYYEIPV